LSNSIIANGSNYEDIITESDRLFLGEFAIQSKVITNPFIKLIVPLTSRIEDSLIAFNPKLKPEKDKRGLQFQSEISFIQKDIKPENFSLEYLTTFKKYYCFKIDTTFYKTDFVITNIKNQLTLESYIGIQGLSEGKHIIEFLSLSSDDSLLSIRKIPFWFYKN
jgi:hypothetical protein